MRTYGRVALLFATGAPAAVARAYISTTHVASGTCLCVKDAVDIAWYLDKWEGGTELIWIEVQDLAQDRTVARFDIFQYGHIDRDLSPSLDAVEAVPKSLERLHSVIHCLQDGPFKTPSVEAVEWSRAVDRRSSMILTFSESTNRPDLGNAAAINNAVLINDGNTQMQSGTGSWSPDGRVLTVVDMDPDTWEVVTASISNGTFHAAPRKKLLLGAEFSRGGHGHENRDSPSGKLQGNLTMRMSSPGRFGLRLHVGDAVQARSDDDIVVQLCPEQVTVLDGSTIAAARRRSGGTVLPRPLFAVEGVLAMPGDNWLKVPHRTFPVERSSLVGRHESGSWSMALWLYLLDDADESFRGLFYKGDGGDMGRTPSAWLRPYSNRIALRVTSTVDPDIGADSIAALDARVWHHLAFSFENNTDNDFSATLFVNGLVDISVAFRNIDVVGNDGPLHLGRDPSLHGPRSLVSMVRVWEGPLSPEQVNAMFQESRPLFFGEGSTSLKSRYPAIPAVASLLSSQTGTAFGKNEEISIEPELKRLGDAAYATAAEATVLCKPFAERLEMYKVAAEAGNTESRLRYASLLMVGREHVDGDGATSCGREKEAEARGNAEVKWNTGGRGEAAEQLERAVRDGSHRAAFMLATLMLSGLDGAAGHDRSSEGCTSCRSYRVSPVSQLAGVGVGAAVLDQWVNAVDCTREGEGNRGSLKSWDVSATARAIGMLHFAAIGGHSEAQLALGLRYLEGNGVQVDVETAAWYLGCAAETAYVEYHVVGKQPIIEMQRLTEANEEVVATGQRGEDDSAIQYQTHRAEQGHVPSQLALGDLFYWGARGVPRDQVRALEYFNSAATAGDSTAQCAAAGMYLRGEGGEVNHTRAVELYEVAAEDNNVRALNGLGFEYYNGNTIPRNLTKAYDYFQRAADMKQDADSLFNAGHCLATGTGTVQDLERAAELFRVGAAWGHVDCAYELGTMSAQGRGVKRNPADAAVNMQIVAQVGSWGRRLRAGFDCYLQGDLLCALALYAQMSELGYEVAASNAAFLLDRGKIRVDEPYPGTTYVNMRGVKGPVGDTTALPTWKDTMATRFHIMAATKGYLPSFLAIGDAFFYGRGGLPRNSAAACWWYSRASTSGVVRGSYNLGYMHEHGLGVGRDYGLALAYYDRARMHAPAGSDVDQRLNGMPVEVLVFLAKVRLFLNRASGGRLAGFWEDRGREESDTSDWLPDWVLLGAIVNTLRACMEWVSTLWTLPPVLTHLEGKAQEGGVELAVDNILLLVLSMVLVAVLTVRRRKPQVRT